MLNIALFDHLSYVVIKTCCLALLFYWWLLTLRMSDKKDSPIKVLFLCTGNSCRSIIGEALMNHMGEDRYLHNITFWTACIHNRWEGYSAGSKPTGKVHPGAFEILKKYGIENKGYCSKSWNSMSETNFDLAVTVCDNAANEVWCLFVDVLLSSDSSHVLTSLEEVLRFTGAYPIQLKLSVVRVLMKFSNLFMQHWRYSNLIFRTAF